MTESHPFREMDFPSIPENINLIESLVEELKKELNLSEELEANILVSLSEAVNNAIFHGNHSDPEKMIHMKMDINPVEIVFIIEDQGIGFNEKDVRDPTSPENLDKPTGRGIFLMRNLADRVLFSDGGRVVQISFSRR